MTGCLPCAMGLAEGGAGEAMVVAVAVMEPDASRVTETVPDGLVMDAEPAPSLLTVAVAVLGGGGVTAADAFKKHAPPPFPSVRRSLKETPRRSRVSTLPSSSAADAVEEEAVAPL